MSAANYEELERCLSEAGATHAGTARTLREELVDIIKGPNVLVFGGRPQPVPVGMATFLAVYYGDSATRPAIQSHMPPETYAAISAAVEALENLNNAPSRPETKAQKVINAVYSSH